MSDKEQLVFVVRYPATPESGLADHYLCMHVLPHLRDDFTEASSYCQRADAAQLANNYRNAATLGYKGFGPAVLAAVKHTLILNVESGEDHAQTLSVDACTPVPGDTTDAACGPQPETRLPADDLRQPLGPAVNDGRDVR